MKILHVTPAYIPAYRYGGPIHSVHALNKYLVRAGAEVTVYTTAINGSVDLDVPISTSTNLRPVDLDGVKVHYFKPGAWRFWFHSPDMRRALAEYTKDFDIVHITSVFLSVSTLGARAAVAAGRPYLISPRGSLMRAPLEKKSPLKKSLYMALMERKNLENADAIHFTTEAEKIEYGTLGYRLRKAVVIPNGLDAETMPPGDMQGFRKKFRIAPEKRVILFLGRLNWKKGLDTLIPAFAMVAKEIPEAVLLIAGGDDENYKETLDKLVDACDVRDKVVFTGPLDGAERSAAYQSAEVFVLPSYAENFAITVAEAMHFGVPVVVSENVGLAPEVARAETGIVVRKEERAAAAAMVELLRDTRSARAMGERGRALVAAEFSYDKVARAFLGAYNEIIQGHRDQ